MKLILVRHGETKENINGIMQGTKYGTLSKKGIEQSKKLAKRLKKYKFDLVFCSDLKRTKQTAKEILKFHPKVKIHYTKKLREKNWGTYEGKHRDILFKAEKRSNKPPYLFKPKGGENFEELQKRSINFYNYLIKKYKNKNVLIITHGGLLISLLLYLFSDKWDNHEKYRQWNAAVTIINVDKNNKHKVKLMNCIKHL